ncbi:sialate O-acetylesterase [Actibacterium sp. D379-3]
MGFSITLSDAIRAAAPDRQIIFIPCAQGSTAFGTNHWNPGDARYDYMVARANAFTAAHPDWPISAVCWLQGEHDVPYWTGYEAALNTMIAQARADIDGIGSTTPWVLGQIHRDVQAGARINQFTNRVPYLQPHTAVVSSDGMVKTDEWHFNAASYRVLGGRFYDAIAVAAANDGSAGTKYGNEVDAAKLGEWLLGDDNTAMEDTVSGQVLTPVGAAPSHSAGYLSTAGRLAGLEGPVADTPKQSLVTVLRLRNAGSNTILYGNLAPYGTTAGYAALNISGTIYANAKAKPMANENMPWGTANTTDWVLSFIAMTDAAGGADDPGDIAVWGVGRDDVLTLDGVQATDRALFAVNPGIGDVAYDNGAYTVGVDCAYFAVYDGRLRHDQLQTIYTEVKTALAARGIAVA